MTKTYCVIGDPISHSLSPEIYNCLFSYYGLQNCTYIRERITPQTLPAFISSLPSRGICGFNITMPLKTTVLPYLDYQDPSAAHGANTVVVEDTLGLAGWSTDAQGFERSLELHGRSLRGASVVFIGSGGAAQTLIRLAADKAANITVLNRTPAHAAQFEDLENVSVGPLSALGSSVRDCSLLVNCTPLGMTGVGADFTDLSFLRDLPSSAFVCDLIYDPPQTRFLAEAARTGHEVMNGLWMLIWQAFYAFEHFTRIMPDMEAFTAVRDSIRTR